MAGSGVKDDYGAQVGDLCGGKEIGYRDLDIVQIEMNCALGDNARQNGSV